MHATPLDGEELAAAVYARKAGRKTGWWVGKMGGGGGWLAPALGLPVSLNCELVRRLPKMNYAVALSVVSGLFCLPV